MKKIVLLLLLTPLFSSSVYSQYRFINNERYNSLIKKAVALYEQHFFKTSGLTFDSAFASTKESGLAPDLYNAACAWSLADNTDKAFFYLRKSAVEGKWSDIDHTLTDQDLLSLHNDKRWLPLADIIRKNKEAATANINKPLADSLAIIDNDDQYLRSMIDSIKDKFGWQSPEMISLWKNMAHQDSINVIKIRSIIQRYGWPGPDIVGYDGNKTVFLVIQHADSLTQVTYLPLLREAVKNGKAAPKDLALLEDRVLTKQGKEQIYGSQLKTDDAGKYVFFPIKDEANVNKRRASMGLGALEDYAKLFGIEYHVPVAGEIKK